MIYSKTFEIGLVVVASWSLVPVLLLLVFSASIRGQAIRLFSSITNVYLCWRHPINSRDGKLSLPTCPYLWPNGQGDVGKFLEGVENSELWEKQHGKVYRIWSGTTSEVVLTRPEDVQTVFRDSGKHTKAANNDAGWLMGEILGKCVGLISGSEWQKVRSVTEVPFLHHNSTHYLTNIERRTKSHFESLHACGRLSQGLLNPVDDLKLLPFWIIADIVYHELSPEMETWLKALVPLRELLFQRVVSGGLPRFWWSQYFPAKANKELAEFKDKWATFNNAAHQRSLASSSNAPIEYMYGEMRSGRISPEQLYQTLDEVLFANLDVTIGGISWNLLFLGAYNDSQADLRAEVVDQSRAARGVRSRWEQYLLSSSTLLAATIFESARLKPLAAFSVPQAAPTDRAVGDFVIPAGTNFIIDSYALNIRNPYWGNDSSKYRPTRFLERNKTETRYHYWRFGFGTRTCMGRYVADSILKTILVHLVKNYKLSLLEDGKEWNRDSKTWITHPKTDVRCERIISESRQD